MTGSLAPVFRAEQALPIGASTCYGQPSAVRAVLEASGGTGLAPSGSLPNPTWGEFLSATRPRMCGLLIIRCRLSIDTTASMLPVRHYGQRR